MNETELQSIEAWFAKRKGKWVNVVLAGQIVGGRFDESPQIPRDFSYHDSTLKISFDTTEVLIVERPTGVLLANDDALTIHRASRVTFGWHYYGRPQISENWCEERYRLAEETIHYERTGPLSPTKYDLSVSDGNLVELV